MGVRANNQLFCKNASELVLLLFLLLCFSSIELFCQTISPDRTTIWSEAGLEHEINYTTTLNVLDYGADPSGVSDSKAAFQNTINALFNQGGGRCFIPAGIYAISNTINVKSNVILIGEGSESTIINISGSHGFKLAGTISANIDTVTTAMIKGDTQINVSNGTNYQVGDIIKLYPEDGNLVTSDWALKTTGQMARIAAIQGSALTLHQPLRMDYPLNYNTTIRKINAIENAGIHCLRINKTNSSSSLLRNIFIRYAYNCEVTGIESNLTNFAHIGISSGLHTKIYGNYFHHGHDYGTGGKAYGVELGGGSAMNLIENNIFKHLRHSVLIQAGANGNVISYNYSLDPYKTTFFGGTNITGDLVFHGNYPYLNLAEGNIMQYIHMDVSHGENGPYNTIFRNRTELHGYVMSSGTGNNQNIAGLEISGGSYSISGSNHITHLNNHLGVLIPDGNGSIPEASQYLLSAPSYISNWPPIGHDNTLDQYSIEAKSRYLSGSGFTVCQAPASNVNCNIVSLITDDMTPGTLRFAMECAESGDTIYFSPSLNDQHIIIKNSTINHNKNLILCNDPSVFITIESSSALSLFEITAIGQLHIYNLTFVFTQTPTTASIVNNGQLLLDNVSLSSETPFPADKNIVLNYGTMTIKNQVKFE